MSWAAAFATTTPAEPAAEICTCTHALKGHCKGNVGHSYYKDELRQVRNPRMEVCRTRHCLAPLCSCIDYTPGENK